MKKNKITEMKLRRVIKKELNEMAYSSPDAQKAIQKDLKAFSDLLGKTSQKVIKGMMDGVKGGHYDAMDIQAALTQLRPSSAHGYEAEFISNLWLKMRDKFRKYIPGGKLRRQK